MTTTRGYSATMESGSNNKKKFGKNLNKLQKPPAPPIANGLNSQRRASSQNNGLLLLSTKRSSASQTQGGGSGGGGLLSNKPNSSTSQASTVTPTPAATSIRSDLQRSAHEALVEAVMGASRNEAQKEPDAWGVAATDTTTTKQEEEPTSSRTVEANNSDAPRRYHNGESDNHRENYDHEHDNWRRSNNNNNNSTISSTSKKDDQFQHMSKLAQDRAEKKRMEEATRVQEQRQRAAQRLKELDEKAWTTSAAAAAAQPRKLFDPYAEGDRPKPSETRMDTATTSSSRNVRSDSAQNNNTRSAVTIPAAAVEAAVPEAPVIHVASYEDRDRGERNTNTGPRMLYDPKSGSMVAVSEKTQNANAKSKKNKKSEAKANGKKGKNSSTSSNNSSAQRNNTKRRGAEVESSGDEKLKVKKNRPARLPRTCGVLYVRDEKGSNYYSADGCDGDRGYGCHAVPGGSIRNAVAFAKFQEEQLGKDVSTVPDEWNNENGQQVENYLVGGYTSSEPAQEQIDWVKPNEKIELITGAEDSPTLQATAAPWAPVHFVAEAKSTVSVDSGMNHSLDGDEGNDDEDEDAFGGLGFNPTENMDAVMMSPSLSGGHATLENVDLTSLTLDPPAVKPDAPTTSNIFAFGSSATWGTSESKKGVDNWSMLGPTLTSSTENQESSVVGTPASFLGFPTNNSTWGGLAGFGGTPDD